MKSLRWNLNLKKIILPLTTTQHYLVLIRLQRKIYLITSLQFLSDLKSTIFDWMTLNFIVGLLKKYTNTNYNGHFILVFLLVLPLHLVNKSLMFIKIYTYKKITKIYSGISYDQEIAKLQLNLKWSIYIFAIQFLDLKRFDWKMDFNMFIIQYSTILKWNNSLKKKFTFSYRI